MRHRIKLKAMRFINFISDKKIDWNNSTNCYFKNLHITPAATTTLYFICITFYILFYFTLNSTKVSREYVVKTTLWAMKTKSTALPINIFSKVLLLSDE